MSREQFDAMMPYITDHLAAMIAQRQSISETDAVTRLYDSQLYALLEQEDTKIWQYSTEMLYALFEEELRTGNITFPDV